MPRLRSTLSGSASPCSGRLLAVMVPGEAPIASSTGSTRTAASSMFSTLTTVRRSTTARNSDKQHPARIELDHAKYVPNSDGQEPEPIVAQPAFLGAQDLGRWN